MDMDFDTLLLHAALHYFRLGWFQMYLIDVSNNDTVYMDSRIQFLLDAIEDRLKMMNTTREILKRTY